MLIRTNIESFVNLMRRTFLLDLETRHTVQNLAVVNQMVSFCYSFDPFVLTLFQIHIAFISVSVDSITDGDRRALVSIAHPPANQFRLSTNCAMTLIISDG